MHHRTSEPRILGSCLVVAVLVLGGVQLGSSPPSFYLPEAILGWQHSGSSARVVVGSSVFLGSTFGGCVAVNVSTNVADSNLYADPITGNLYVFNGVDAIYEFDTTSNTLSPPIFLKGGGSMGPDLMAFDQSNGLLYVANGAQPFVSVIDVASNQVVANISLLSHAVGIAFDVANHEIYVEGYGGLVATLVSVINTTSNSIVSTMPVGALPASIAFDSSNDEVYVANQNSYNISVINGSSNRVVGSIPVGSMPGSIVADSLSGMIYVANPLSASITVINASTNRLVATIPTPRFGEFGSMAVNEREGILYVGGNYSLYAVNLTTFRIVSEVNLSSSNWGRPLSYVVYDGLTSHIYVDSMSGNLYSISTSGNCGASPPPSKLLWSEPLIWIAVSLGILTIALVALWRRRVVSGRSRADIGPSSPANAPAVSESVKKN